MLVRILLTVFLPIVLSKDNGLGLTPPMGWNTWCTLGKCERDYCDASEIKSIADAMVANGMRDAGYTYINLDDCWADVRDSDGNIMPDKDRFPDGMAPLIKYLNDKGFKFGLYTDSGIYTCNNGSRNHSIPGSYGHYSQDADTYAKWGVEYVKMDWCSTVVNGKQLDPHVIYKTMSDALDKTGKKIWLNSCEWGVDNPWEWMGQFANSWRTGPDHEDNWSSTSKIIEINANLGKYSNPGGWNDPDFIFTGGQGCVPPVNEVHCPGQTDAEYRTEFTMWALMAAPLIVATDIRNMTDTMKKVLLNKDLIAVNQDSLGYGGRRIANYTSTDCIGNACQIWSKDLADGSKAIALYNADEEAHTILVDVERYFGWSAITKKDLWTGESTPEATGSFSVEVAPHGVEAYKIAKSS